ncbi:MAG: asparagine synthase (glutamine-hydrolyzing) [Wolinella sp.]
MCRIFGYISKGKIPANIDEAIKGIAHQGHDSLNVWNESCHNHSVLLARSRLSIVDLGAHSSQPLNHKEHYQIVYDGEIYNCIELRNKLRASGYSFTTESDAEVVVAAYDCFSDSCVEHFNGMWAFAIFDMQNGKLFCSRDRFGGKSFYYFFDSQNFVFASEIKALLPLCCGAYVNYSRLVPYVSRGFSDFGNETFFRNIYRLEASTNFTYDLQDGKKYFKKYYTIPKRNTKLDVDELYRLLYDSVALRLRSDVKVGACLSGGLDSSGIVALASRMQGGLEAIHAKSSLSENDESAYARHVADFLRIKLHIIEPSFEDFKACVDEVFYTQDEPFGSSSIFMQYFVMKKAKELGIKVLLDGQGADEVFLGYEHYLKFIYKSLHEDSLCDEESFFNNLKSFKYNKASILRELEGIYNPALACEIIAQKGNINPKHLYKNELLKLLRYGKFNEFAHSEIFIKKLPPLLRFEDRNSMRNGIKTRLPFLDVNVVECALSLPLNEHFQQGYLKYALRKMLNSRDLLPQNVIWRYNKFGFESPQKLWIDSYREEMLEEIHESKILKELFVRMDIRRDDFLWKLFSIAKWEQIFNVKI